MIGNNPKKPNLSDISAECCNFTTNKNPYFKGLFVKICFN